MNTTVYRVHECFDTFQGEGLQLGRHAFFIRLFGCPLHCPWCDSAGTWHKDYVPPDVTKMTAEQLAHLAELSGAPFCVITGGEPAMYDLTELTKELRRRNIATAIETSGAFPLKGIFDWITVSPKRAKYPLLENIQKASEFKIIVDTESAAKEWEDFLADYFLRYPLMDKTRTIWLHVEWSQRNNQALLNTIVEKVKTGKWNFRAGVQMHKYFKVDEQDPRTRKAVPLGGNPSLGF